MLIVCLAFVRYASCLVIFFFVRVIRVVCYFSLLLFLASRFSFFFRLVLCVSLASPWSVRWYSSVFFSLQFVSESSTGHVFNAADSPVRLVFLPCFFFLGSVPAGFVCVLLFHIFWVSLVLVSRGCLVRVLSSVFLSFASFSGSSPTLLFLLGLPLLFCCGYFWFLSYVLFVVCFGSLFLLSSFFPLFVFFSFWDLRFRSPPCYCASSSCVGVGFYVMSYLFFCCFCCFLFPFVGDVGSSCAVWSFGVFLISVFFLSFSFCRRFPVVWLLFYAAVFSVSARALFPWFFLVVFVLLLLCWSCLACVFLWACSFLLVFSVTFSVMRFCVGCSMVILLVVFFSLSPGRRAAALWGQIASLWPAHRFALRGSAVLRCV